MDYDEDFDLEETNVEDYECLADQQADGSDSEADDGEFEEHIARVRGDEITERTGADRQASMDIQQFSFTKLVSERAVALAAGATTILTNSEWQSLEDRNPETIAAYELVNHKNRFPLDLVISFSNGFIEYLEMADLTIDYELY
jgi:hypothetical protein